MYLQCRPDFLLAPYIEKVWYCEGYQATHRRERVLPNGRFQLIINLARAAGPSVILGMSTRHSILETASIQSVMGVVFRPGGALPFFSPPADEFSNRPVALDDLWNTPGRELRERLLETANPAARMRILQEEFKHRLGRHAELHCAVRFGLAEFHCDPLAVRIVEVAREAGISRRRFGGLFREQVGLTPKLYCRLLRFHQVVRRIASGAPVDWAQVSLDGGYYDQAHMAHEFHEFAGISPGGWLTSERPFLNHAVAD
jgi:AraC-like DNA-binding protein